MSGAITLTIAQKKSIDRVRLEALSTGANYLGLNITSKFSFSHTPIHAENCNDALGMARKQLENKACGKNNNIYIIPTRTETPKTLK